MQDCCQNQSSLDEDYPAHCPMVPENFENDFLSLAFKKSTGQQSSMKIYFTCATEWKGWVAFGMPVKLPCGKGWGGIKPPGNPRIAALLTRELRIYKHHQERGLTSYPLLMGLEVKFRAKMIFTYMFRHNSIYVDVYFWIHSCKLHWKKLQQETIMFSLRRDEKSKWLWLISLQKKFFDQVTKMQVMNDFMWKPVPLEQSQVCEIIKNLKYWTN